MMTAVMTNSLSCSLQGAHGPGAAEAFISAHGGASQFVSQRCDQLKLCSFCGAPNPTKRCSLCREVGTGRN
jgi:membrane protease subunit (stomatin/prohibitin family)